MSVMSISVPCSRSSLRRFLTAERSDRLAAEVPDYLLGHFKDRGIIRAPALAAPRSRRARSPERPSGTRRCSVSEPFSSSKTVLCAQAKFTILLRAAHRGRLNEAARVLRSRGPSKPTGWATWRSAWIELCQPQDFADVRSNSLAFHRSPPGQGATSGALFRSLRQEPVRRAP
jgi:hypothetical protein